jgi:hypothetical protein
MYCNYLLMSNKTNISESSEGFLPCDGYIALKFLFGFLQTNYTFRRAVIDNLVFLVIDAMV